SYRTADISARRWTWLGPRLYLASSPAAMMARQTQVVGIGCLARYTEGQSEDHVRYIAGRSEDHGRAMRAGGRIPPRRVEWTTQSRHAPRASASWRSTTLHRDSRRVHAGSPRSI